MCASYFEDDKNSYKFIDYDEEAKCESGFKQCGHINQDAEMKNLHKILCIKNNLECPLNYIAITDNISSYDPNDANIESFENGYYLVTSNKNITNGIITRIKIAEGIYPCYERDRYSNTTSQFPTMNGIENFNCSNEKIDDKKDNNLRNLHDEDEEKQLISEGYDVRYIKFDTLKKINVLTDNDLDYLYSRLPNVTNWRQDIQTSSFNLFYLNVFVVKEECHNFNTYENNIDRIKNVQAFRVIFALFHILIYVLLFSILGLIKVIMAWRHSLLFGIKVGLSFIIFIVNFRLIYSSQEILKNFENFETDLDNCLDEVSKAILSDHDINVIIEDLEKYYRYEEYVWIVYIFFNFIEACRLVHKIYIRCKNTYRRNIANRDIGAENLKNIFQTVRNQLEKKRNQHD